jgi:pyruvate kinase
MRKTKIVATLGPATSTPERLRALIEAGMDVARINMSHGNHAEHAERIALLRQEAKRLGRPLATLMDLQGPKIRTGDLIDGQPVRLEDGQTLTLTTQPVQGDAHCVSASYEYLPRDVHPGDRILVSDGLIELQVLSAAGDEVITRVVHGGMLREHQGINLPGVAISAPAVTPKDLEDLSFGLAQGVDYIAISFVRRPDDVAEVKTRVIQAGYDTPVIAKLEKPEALNVLDGILNEADGVMVARGDMGVELSPERVPVVQKEIIRAANRAALPVITATQMLESMIHHAQPTRAEVSDVANAILDGSDAVMLSGETAIGQFPVQAVRMMARIAETVESSRGHWATSAEPRDSLLGIEQVPQAIGSAVEAIVQALDVRAVCVLTKTGSSARLVASYRPEIPVLGITPFETTYRRLALLRGVTPLLVVFSPDEQQYYEQVQSIISAGGYAQPGELVVVTGGHPIAQGGPTNFVKVMTVGQV